MTGANSAAETMPGVTDPSAHGAEHDTSNVVQFPHTANGASAENATTQPPTENQNPAVDTRPVTERLTFGTEPAQTRERQPSKAEIKDREAREFAAQTLESRARNLQELSRSKVLEGADQLVAEHGEDLAAKLRSGELTETEKAQVWWAVNRERSDMREFVRSLNKTASADERAQARQHARERGIDTLTAEQLTQGLDRLDRASKSIASEIIGKDVGDKFDWRTSQINDENFIREGQKTLEGLARSSHNKSFAELLATDPVEAVRIQRQAEQEAMIKVSGGEAQVILSELVDVDTEAIKTMGERAQAPVDDAKINAAREDLTREAGGIQNIGEKRDRAREAWDNAEIAAAKARKEAEAAAAATRTGSEQLDRITGSRDRANQRIDEINAEITRLIDLQDQAARATANPPTGGGPNAPRQQRQQGGNRGSSIDTLSRERTSLNEEIAKLDREERELFTNRLRAETAAAEAEQAVTTRKTSFEEIRDEYARRREPVAAAEDKLKKLQEPKTPEAQEKGRAFTLVASTIEGSNNIVGRLGAGSNDISFTAESLSSAETKNGSYEGTDRVREYLLTLGDKTLYNSELARKILSDATIAKAIIREFGINPYELEVNVPNPNSSPDLSGISNAMELFRAITKARGELKGLEGQAKTDKEALIKTLEGSIPMDKLLPKLKTDPVRVGRMMTRMLNELGRSAERGEPYLDFDNSLLESRSEANITADLIRQEGRGEALISPLVTAGKQTVDVRWIGQIQDRDRTGTGNVDLSLRIQETMTRDGIVFEVFGRRDDALAKSLPEKWSSSLGKELRVFYDQTGALVTSRVIEEIDTKENQMNGKKGWVRLTVANAGSSNPDQAYENLANSLNYLTGGRTESLPRYMEISTANSMLDARPQIRRAMLVGFTPVRIGPDVVDMSPQGEFMITTAGKTIPLESYFKEFTESELKRLKVSSLNDEQRKDVQAEYDRILQAVGREVLVTQQRSMANPLRVPGAAAAQESARQAGQAARQAVDTLLGRT